MVPLVAERLSCNVTSLCNSVANNVLQTRYAIYQLHCNASDKLSCVANISTASRKKEASPEGFVRRVFDGYRSRHRRLASAGHTAQPEDTRRAFSIGPAVYLLEEADAGIRKASRVVLSLVCVERRSSSVRQTIKQLSYTSSAS